MKEHTLTLTVQDINIILQGLGELKFSYALPVVQTIERQVRDQGNMEDEELNVAENDGG